MEVFMKKNKSFIYVLITTIITSLTVACIIHPDLYARRRGRGRCDARRRGRGRHGRRRYSYRRRHHPLHGFWPEIALGAAFWNRWPERRGYYWGPDSPWFHAGYYDYPEARVRIHNLTNEPIKFYIDRKGRTYDLTIVAGNGEIKTFTRLIYPQIGVIRDPNNVLRIKPI